MSEKTPQGDVLVENLAPEAEALTSQEAEAVRGGEVSLLHEPTHIGTGDTVVVSPGGRVIRIDPVRVETPPK